MVLAGQSQMICFCFPFVLPIQLAVDTQEQNTTKLAARLMHPLLGFRRRRDGDLDVQGKKPLQQPLACIACITNFFL